MADVLIHQVGMLEEKGVQLCPVLIGIVKVGGVIISITTEHIEILVPVIEGYIRVVFAVGADAVACACRYIRPEGFVFLQPDIDNAGTACCLVFDGGLVMISIDSMEEDWMVFR
jgi:hypothetical protein